MPKLSDFAKEEVSQRSGASGWFSPVEGENVVRILSPEYAVQSSHYIPSERKSHECFGKEEGCPFDTEVTIKTTGKKALIHRPTRKYLMWMIDRKDGKIKIGKFPYTVVKTIVEFASSKDYAFEDAPPYDVTIVRKKTGPAATDVEYSVIPARTNTELTADEKKEYEKCNPVSEIVEKMRVNAKNKVLKGSSSETEEVVDLGVDEDKLDLPF